MPEKIILVDFAGTLVKAEVIQEANKYRATVLKKAMPTQEQHADPEVFYKVNREFVEKLTGLKADAKVKYRKNDLGFMELTGEQVQNQIATNLFQIGMFMSAKKHRTDMIPKGLIEELKRIQKTGYKLAIVSGVRTDIISGMLQIAEIDIEFDYLYGQPPILGAEHQDKAVAELKQKGEIVFCLGDKLSDLERVPEAKKIFVKWGHSAGGEEEYADFTISKPAELKNIIK